MASSFWSTASLTRATRVTSITLMTLVLATFVVTLSLFAGCARQATLASSTSTSTSTSSSSSSSSREHDAYIWQRQWTASLDRAIEASASRVRAWRVLAAEIDAGGRTHESFPHLDVLTKAGKPVIPVIRISGRLDDWDEDALISRTQTIVRSWRDAGVSVTGVEIDHDCPTSSLRRYASFLAALRRAHQGDATSVAARSPSMTSSTAAAASKIALSITALPTWLESARLPEVLRQADEAVLQVHAVQHPEAGLFDRKQALTWARAWAQVSDVPFRIALPTYGSRVTWTSAGRITSVESEARTFANPAAGRELVVTPLDITAFLDELSNARPSHLAGLVWFRVPTGEDERAWSVATWHAVIDGRARSTEISAAVEPNATIRGLYDVYLRNGGVDAMIPERVTITSSGACESADGVGAYAMEKGSSGIEFRRVSPRLLARDRRTLIGWVRCPAGEIHARAGS